MQKRAGIPARQREEKKLRIEEVRNRSISRSEG
jgi:hypothetical protein